MSSPQRPSLIRAATLTRAAALAEIALTLTSAEAVLGLLDTELGG